ncbi:hypothetical protein C8J56DRAFT_125174 [Mycena floridula]|nr:hypothetical protein C8J56DRAFT_125174 [Mycena floridula]
MHCGHFLRSDPTPILMPLVSCTAMGNYAMLSSDATLSAFLAVTQRLYPSLSFSSGRLEVMAIFRCAQARDSQYPSQPSEQWPFSYINSKSRDSIFRDHECNSLWVEMWSFLNADVAYDDKSSFPDTHATNAAETNRIITLLGLCIFLWEDVSHILQPLIDDFCSVINIELIRFVSPLTKGSIRAQRAYSAAILLITITLERATLHLGIAERNETHQYPVSAVSELRRALLDITDDIATTWAKRIFSSPLWLPHYGELIPVSWLEHPPIRQMIGIEKLYRYLRGRPRLWSLTLKVPGHHEVDTLAGLDSVLQIQLAEPLNLWLTECLRDISDEKPIALLFRLLATVDDPEAVVKMQRALRRFLTAPATANIESTEHESYLEAAREALEQLKVTASQPSVIFKALSLHILTSSTKTE